MSNLSVENVYTRSAAKELTRKHFWKLLGMMLTVLIVTYAVMLGGMALTSPLFSSSSSAIPAILLSLVVYFASLLIASGLGLGMTSAMLDICRGEEAVPVRRVFSRMSSCLKGLGLSLWVGLKILLWALPSYAVIIAAAIPLSSSSYSSEGSVIALTIMPLLAIICALALVIPAAYRYMLSTYVLADKPATGVFDCVKQSKDMMKGHKWQAFKLVVPLFLILYAAIFGYSIIVSLLIAALGDTAAAAILAIVLFIGIMILALYFSLRIALGYCLFYLKRSEPQETAEPAPEAAE